MTDSNDPLGLEALPAAEPVKHRRVRLPLVWLVPIIAAAAGGWIAARAIMDRGPSITIRFSDADGIESGKTKVRFRSVEVGTVKSVTLDPDRTVRATVDMARFAKPFLVADTRFWVVRPRLGANGVSGLGTILSGAFIGMDAGTASESARSFIALNAPPPIATGAAGREFILEASDLGSLSVGAPAYFHHLQVGQISAVSLNEDGRRFTLELFVDAPYARFVTPDSRFWHASGVDASIDSNGVRVQTQSLTTIMAGGVAFESPDNSSATESPPNARFTLAANREAALKTPDGTAEQYLVYFNDSLRGLSPGATVDFRGINIGQVVSLNVEYDREAGNFRFPVLINVYPDRLRARYARGAAQPQQHAHALVATMIDKGFRAQLRSANLLTGQLYIALDFFPGAKKEAAQPQLTPMPLPAVSGNIEELQKTFVSVAHKLDQLPLESIGRNLDHSLASLDSTLEQVHTTLLPQADASLKAASQALTHTSQVLASDSVLQTDLHTTLTTLNQAADSIRVLADYLDRHPEALIRGKPKESDR